MNWWEEKCSFIDLSSNDIYRISSKWNYFTFPFFVYWTIFENIFDQIIIYHWFNEYGCVFSFGKARNDLYLSLVISLVSSFTWIWFQIRISSFRRFIQIGKIRSNDFSLSLFIFFCKKSFRGKRFSRLRMIEWTWCLQGQWEHFLWKSISSVIGRNEEKNHSVSAYFNWWSIFEDKIFLFYRDVFLIHFLLSLDRCCCSIQSDMSSSEAFVTLAMDDGYALGALALAKSIQIAQTKRNLVVLISNQVSNFIRFRFDFSFNWFENDVSFRKSLEQTFD